MNLTKEKLPSISVNSPFFLAQPSSFAAAYLYYMLSIGHFFANKDYLIRRQAEEYNSYLLMYLVKGEMSCRFSNIGDDVNVKGGSVILIDCYKAHSYRALAPLEFVYIQFDGNNSGELINKIIAEYGNVFKSDYMARHVELLDEEIKQLSANAQVKESRISVLLHTLLCDLIENMSKVYANRYDNYVEQALQFIDNNLQEDITIDIIARQINISPQHLTREFKSELNTTPYKYIISKRLGMSKNLLMHTDYTIEEIAHIVGFNSSYNYMRTFKTAYNATPTQFRHRKL